MRLGSLALTLLLAAGPAHAEGLEPFSSLPRLDKDVCAALVWSKADDTGPILVIAGDPPVARIQRDGRLKMLPRAGEPAGEGRQTFRGMGITIDLRVELARGMIVAGAPPPEGVLTLVGADGVVAVTPVMVRASCGR